MRVNRQTTALVFLLFVLLVVTATGAAVTAQTTPAGTAQAVPAQLEPTPPPDPTAPTTLDDASEQDRLNQELQDRWEREFRLRRRYRRPVIRIGQDYTLRVNETVRGVTVAFGAARIEGRVEGDLVVIFGPATLASTAVIEGSFVVVGGTATVHPGALVRDEVVTIGAALDLPEGFFFGGQHLAVGARALGDRMESVLPWFTRGLLLGRPIVPGIGWVWSVLGVFFVVYLLINLLAHEPVRASAEILEARPFGSFMVGLMVLLLTGPVVALLAVSIVGIAVIPFAVAALIAAGVVGRVSVLRWIGNVLVAPDSPESRVQALRSFVIGFVLVSLTYMLPVLGLVTWALLGVIGLGAAVLAFLSAWRRENPRPERASPGAEAPGLHQSDAPGPDRSPAAGLGVSGPGTQRSALSGLEVPAGLGLPLSEAAGVPTSEAPPPPPPPPPASPVPPVSSAPSAGVGDLTQFPRAAFLDRAGAFALDVLLVAIGHEVLRGSLLARNDDFVLPLLLIYFIGFWTWKGTTLGGIIVNLRVVKTTGAPLQFVDALVRGLCSIFSFAVLGIGVLWILRDPERQAWHDLAAGTCVVKVPKNWPLPE